jgi:methionyl-tRNA formyltransferase
MDEKMDHGPIIAQRKTSVSRKETYQSLENRLSKKAADFLIETLPQYLQDKIKPKPQDETKATYTKILTRMDGKIDWSKPAEEIEKIVRAFYPWPGAWTEFNKRRLKIIKVEVVPTETETAVKTGRGFLSLETVQPEGKKQMSGQDFFRGHPKDGFNLKTD